MEWISVDSDVLKVKYMRVWVHTESGIVATGYWTGWTWSVDAFLIDDEEDEIRHWAEINYPEGPK